MLMLETIFIPHSASAKPSPKQIKLDEMGKAAQTSILTFARKGLGQPQPLKINHPQVVINGIYYIKDANKPAGLSHGDIFSPHPFRLFR